MKSYGSEINVFSGLFCVIKAARAPGPDLAYEGDAVTPWVYAPGVQAALAFQGRTGSCQSPPFPGAGRATLGRSS